MLADAFIAPTRFRLDDSLTVKIADFGLCRDVSDSDSYQTARASDIPIRWMPPETIEKLEWTNKSDVVGKNRHCPLVFSIQVVSRQLLELGMLETYRVQFTPGSL